MLVGLTLLVSFSGVLIVADRVTAVERRLDVLERRVDAVADVLADQAGND